MTFFQSLTPNSLFSHYFRSPLLESYRKLQLQLHNSPFQLQIQFYNCRNFDQLDLHVKICPVLYQSFATPVVTHL